MLRRFSWMEKEIESLSTTVYQMHFDQIPVIDQPTLVQVNPFQRAYSSMPYRILIKREHAEQILNLIHQTRSTLVTSASSPEAIVTLNNLQELSILIEPLISDDNELRLLIPESFAPLILGQAGNRARLLKEKYSLTCLKVRRTIEMSREKEMVIRST
jgi:hypothetical protein